MSKYNILVIEDDIILLETWKKLLEVEGYDVDIAANGRTALNLWEENIYDVILVDLRIPEVDGREVINTIREKQPFTQIIIISGQGKDRDAIEAVNKHVFRYLRKSKELNNDDVIKAVTEAIQKRDHVLISLGTMAEKTPDEPILFVGTDAYSPQQLYNEVRKGTELGMKFHEKFIKNLTDFEPPKVPIDELLKMKGIIK